MEKSTTCTACAEDVAFFEGDEQLEGSERVRA